MNFRFYRSAARKLLLLVFIQVMFVTMVYGPIAAYLVEAFPQRSVTPPCHFPTILGTESLADCCL